MEPEARLYRAGRVRQVLLVIRVAIVPLVHIFFLMAAVRERPGLLRQQIELAAAAAERAALVQRLDRRRESVAATL